MVKGTTLEKQKCLYNAERPVEWHVSNTSVPYETAIGDMETHVGFITSGQARERIWLLEHPSLYTAGSSANPSDLLKPNQFPVYKTGRGGQYTYHGPGQRVAYVMLDLKRRKPDVRVFVRTLEDWIIATLANFNIKGERRDDRVGVWVARPERGLGHEDKIAAIGVRVRRWVTFHGISINVDPELEHFSGIVPCGVKGHGVTSLVDLGIPISMAEFDVMLKKEFEYYFGPTVSVF